MCRYDLIDELRTQTDTRQLKPWSQEDMVLDPLQQQHDVATFGECSAVRRFGACDHTDVSTVVVPELCSTQSFFSKCLDLLM